jgi:7,8-didemethyl-8-hydroxy-5-deazariboflavin synthase CofG subunit
MTDRRAGPSTEMLCATASRVRDQGKGRVVSFSPKVFIALTRLCRDFCGYCTFRQTPDKVNERFYLSPEEVLEVAQAGEKVGCREALFVLGERPEQRYPEAQRWLCDHGCDSTLEYLCEMCSLVLQETSLYPHSNPGTLSRSELQALKEVNASMGLMLESTSLRLHQSGGPHEHAPSKRPQVRLKTLRLAGELQIPFTTGLLIGIGETTKDRVEALLAIRELQEQYGHIQEVIIQNFRPKPETPMRDAPEASVSEMLDTVARARIILGGEMNIQVPPNLSNHGGKVFYPIYLEAGINDWGGISPVTIDYVNPEAPWPHLAQLRREMSTRHFELQARFPVYPEYILRKSEYLPECVRNRLRSEADPQGYIRDIEQSLLWGGEVSELLTG